MDRDTPPTTATPVGGPPAIEAPVGGPPGLPFEVSLGTPVGRAKDLVRSALAWTAVPLGSLVRVATSEPAVALTFDDGPDPEWTPRIVDLLERFGARGTFFLVGERAARSRDLLARLRAGGHALGNHSWDHTSFRRLDGPARRAQILACDAALGDGACGLFRPPYAEQSLASRLDALRCGQRVVIADVVAEDWRDDAAEVLVGRVLRRLRRGSIVLMHDSLYRTEDARYRSREPLLGALEILLRDLASRLRFVTVPELLALGRPVRQHWYHRLPSEFHRRLA